MRTTILFVLALISSLLINAQDKIDQYAVASYVKIFGQKKAPKNYIILSENQKQIEYVFNFKDGGYIMLKKEGNTIKITGFSENNEFIVKNNPMLKGIEQEVNQHDLSNIEYKEKSWFINTKSSQTKRLTNTVTPFLDDVWGGVNCYDASGTPSYTSNNFTPSHCSPGCVAIASSQVLHYYEWPKRGVGNNVYSDNYDGEFIRHEGFFDGPGYDWNNMLDEYMEVDASNEEKEAIGTLMYNMGTAVKMDYEPTGSTSNLNKIPFVIENFFRFSGHYQSKSWSQFWSRLYESVQQLTPVPIAIENTENGDGHVMIANGYLEIDGVPYYHLNWGWWNNYGMNGWHNIQGWNSGTSGYNLVEGALFDMFPEPEIIAIEPTGNGENFLVKWIVSDRLNWEEFTLEQKVDNGSWEIVAENITEKEYTVLNPTGTVYQLRVKAKSNGFYYSNSFSEIEVYATDNWYNGYVTFGGDQHCFARQTPNDVLNFSGDYTFETWLRITNNNQNNDVVLDQKDVFSLKIHEVNSSDYSIKFSSYSSNETISSNELGSKLQVNTWHHVAISKSGNQTNLFVDGVQRASYSGSNFNLTTSNNALNFGEKYDGTYTAFLEGDIDQLRISSTGRYTSSFTPTRDHQFASDSETIAYFTFQNVHRIRFKDEQHNMSVIATNSSNFVAWNFEESIGSLSDEEKVVLNDVFQVYPNPTTNSINIIYKNNVLFEFNSFSFYLYNINGKRMTRKIQKNKNGISMDISDLNSGVYFLKLETDKFTATKRIIKQ